MALTSLTSLNSLTSPFAKVELLKKSDCCRKIKQKIHPFFGIKWKSGTTEVLQKSQTANIQLFKE